MLIIEISPADKTYPMSSDMMVTMSETLFAAFQKYKFLFGIQEGSSTTVSADKITIEYPGITPDSNEALNFVSRDLSWIIKSCGLGEYLFVSGAGKRPEAGDKVFSTIYLKPTSTIHSAMLKDYKGELPVNHTCSLTNEIIDEPVYLRTRPDIKYELLQLRYWLFTQNHFQDPFTRLPINPYEDIIEDSELKLQIQATVKQKFKELMQAEKQALLDMLASYNLTTSIDDMQKALRIAASKDNVDALKMLLSRVKVNAQDTNPQNLKTALHWAVIKQSTASIKLILKYGGRFDIKDAKGKTALDYAKESDCRDVLDLFIDNLSSKAQAAPSMSRR